MLKRIIIFGILVGCLSSQGRSTLLVIEDNSFIELTKDDRPYFSINEHKYLLAVWGIWNTSASIFSPVYEKSSADDYPGFLYYYIPSNQYGSSEKEIYANSHITPSSSLAIPTGTLMSLGIYDLPYDTTFPLSNEAARVILTDPFWVAPTWTPDWGITQYFFTQSTQAVFGTFSYNGGNEKIGLATPSIPEPSSLSLLALGGVVVALRRRKQV